MSVSFLLCVPSIGCRENLNRANADGDYLNQLSPGNEAEIFAPGLVSTEFGERDAAFSPDGSEFFFSKRVGTMYVLIFIEWKNSKWSKPEVAPFSGRYCDWEPCFSLDGNTLYFVSTNPLISSRFHIGTIQIGRNHVRG